MKLLLKLLLANVRLRPMRTALTALAVTASSCVVVWVVSGYDALLAQSIDENAAKALGRFDLVISGESGGGPRNAGERPGPGSRSAAPSDRPPGGARKGRPRPGGIEEADATASGPRTKSAGSGRGGRGRGGAEVGGGPGGPSLGLARELIDALQQDPQVAETNLTTQSRVTTARATKDPGAPALAKLLRGDRPPVNGAPPLGPPLIGTNAAEPPYELVAGRWIDPTTGDHPEAVLSANYAKSLGVEAGEDLKVNSEVGEWVVKLVGVVEQPSPGGGGRRGGGAGGGSQAGIFVSLPLAETINGYSSRISQINLVLKDQVDPAAYTKTLRQKLASLNVPASIIDIQAMKERLAQGLSQSGSETLAYSATVIALMAALFIIFTTLSMGVSERARELAVLRAVGLTQGQVAGLVILEGLLLALLGWAGGLAAGWGLLTVVASAKPDLFSGGATLGPWCVALTAVAALGGALAAAILPAWRATRVTPLDAMAPPRLASPSRWVLYATLAGLALLTINPILTYVLPMADATRTWAYAIVGYPGMVLGFILLAPWVIVEIEEKVGPWVARLLGLPPRLLASILSANLWRTLGTTVALTVGLGLYIATQTWGYSMLAPFTPGDWVPEMLVGFEPSGLPDTQIDTVKHVKGVIPERCMPLAVEQPRLVKDMTGGGGFAITRQDNVVLIGLDPQVAFGGDDPMIDAYFTSGDRHTALKKLQAGKACLVPDHFLESAGLKLGDPLEMIPPGAPPGKVVSYEVVGAVSLPGWHWMTKMSGLRRQTTRTGALVFAPITDVRRDFRIDRTNFVWLDTDGSVTPEQVEASMQVIAEAHGESKFRVAGVGEVTSRRPYARLTATETVRAGIKARADGMIWGMSQIPLVTLIITSLAVVNTVVSSVRARRWDFGILRALGTTRGGLIRLILAESLLIGLAVCVLGLGFGLMAGWCGTGMARYLSPFGGMRTPLVLPWPQLALGVATTLGLCLLAAVIPAFTTGRTEPLKLLQAGRGTA